MIRHVLLDADGVVQSTREGWHLPLASELGAHADAFFELLAADEHPCLTGDGDFRAIALQRFADRGLDHRFDELFGPFWTGIEPDPDVMLSVESLRRAGYEVHLATNQERHRGIYMRDDLGHGRAFDSMHCSYELGIAKPEPGYFAKVLARVGSQPHEAVFVDDKLENVEAAISVGIKSYRWDRALSAESFTSVLAELGLLHG
jgi:putative hydrolase of the HAD superfamily